MIFVSYFHFVIFVSSPPQAGLDKAGGSPRQTQASPRLSAKPPKTDRTPPVLDPTSSCKSSRSKQGVKHWGGGAGGGHNGVRGDIRISKNIE